MDIVHRLHLSMKSKQITFGFGVAKTCLREKQRRKGLAEMFEEGID